MSSFLWDNAADALWQLIGRIEREGDYVAPRGLGTRELRDVTITITDPSDVLLYGCNRAGYHPAIGAVEGLLLIAGISDPPLLSLVAPQFATFQDGGALHGAYGPRLRTQLPWIVDRLTADPHTRQAVCTIWDPLYDLAGDPARDTPCTVDLLFRVRDGKLTLKTHMRSNDLWRGWCYDVIMFTMLQQTMAHALNLPVGPYVHHASSLHLYDVDRPAAARVTAPDGGLRQKLLGLPVRERDDTVPLHRWHIAQDWAKRLLYDRELDSTTTLTTTERWLHGHAMAAHSKNKTRKEDQS